MCKSDYEDKRLFTEELERVISRLVEQSKKYNCTELLEGDGIFLSPISVEGNQKMGNVA